MDWTSEQIDQLRQLWGLALSTAEIGRRMRISKNAVVGKARRIGLPARPSPIKAGGAPRPPRPRPVRDRPTLTPLTSVPVAAPPPPPPPPVFRGPSLPCSWPCGEPKTRSFRYCDAPSVPGKPYCGEHCRTAYVRVRDQAA